MLLATSLLLALNPTPETAVASYRLDAYYCGAQNRDKRRGTAVLVRDWNRCTRSDRDCSAGLLLTSLHVVERCESVQFTRLSCNAAAPADPEATHTPDWVTPDNTRIETWPALDLAAIPVPADALSDAIPVDVGFGVKPQTDQDVALFAWRSRTMCPYIDAEVVETVSLQQQAYHLYTTDEIDDPSEVVGGLPPTTKIILYVGAEASSGSSGGGLWDPQRGAIIGIHQAGFADGRTGWSIQLPAREQLPSCQSSCAKLGPGQNESWPEFAELGMLQSRDWSNDPKSRPQALLGVELGLEPLAARDFSTASVANLAASGRASFELRPIDAREQTAFALMLAATYRYGRHPVVYTRSDGALVSTATNIFHGAYLEFGAQARLLRQRRFGANVSLALRYGLDFPGLEVEGFDIVHRLGFPLRVELRVELRPRVAMLVALRYAPELFGNPSRFVYSGAIDRVFALDAREGVFAAHAFGLGFGFEFAIGVKT